MITVVNYYMWCICDLVNKPYTSNQPSSIYERVVVFNRHPIELQALLVDVHGSTLLGSKTNLFFQLLLECSQTEKHCKYKKRSIG